jgi:transglycosylase-like protein
MSRKKKSNLLIALGVVVMAAGVALALDLPAKTFSSEDEPPALTVDAAAVYRAGQDARAARIHHLMTSKMVLGVPRTKLNSIAACESHGDPRSIGGGGLYRGKYQFDRQTWHSIGGKGDPAKAPEYQQDRLAAALYKERGTSPWPVCG